jgi:hypothetical protein
MLKAINRILNSSIFIVIADPCFANQCSKSHVCVVLSDDSTRCGKYFRQKCVNMIYVWYKGNTEVNQSLHFHQNFLFQNHAISSTWYLPSMALTASLTNSLKS